MTQRELDGWFGEEAVDENDIVAGWQEEVKSAVSFKMVTFPNSGNFAYVLIRGTTNNWDMLTGVCCRALRYLCRQGQCKSSVGASVSLLCRSVSLALLSNCRLRASVVAAAAACCFCLSCVSPCYSNNTKLTPCLSFYFSLVHTDAQVSSAKPTKRVSHQP